MAYSLDNNCKQAVNLHVCPVLVLFILFRQRPVMTRDSFDSLAPFIYGPGLFFLYTVFIPSLYSYILYSRSYISIYIFTIITRSSSSPASKLSLHIDSTANTSQMDIHAGVNELQAIRTKLQVLYNNEIGFIWIHLVVPVQTFLSPCWNNQRDER